MSTYLPAGVLLATVAGVTSLPISFLAGWLMDHFGRKATMVPGFIGVAIMMLLLAVTAMLHLSLVWYVATFLAGVAAQSLTGGSIQTIGADVAPPQGRGMFLGLWRFTGQVGQTASPVAFAFLASTTGYGLVIRVHRGGRRDHRPAAHHAYSGDRQGESSSGKLGFRACTLAGCASRPDLIDMP